MLRKIAFFVIGSHLLFVIFLFFSPVKKISPPSKHVVVRTTTFRPVEKKATSKPQHSSSQKAKTAPSKPVQEKSKKSIAKEPPKKKKVEKKAPEIPQNLLEELEEIVTKIESKKEKGYSPPQLEVPSAVGDFALKSDGYEESLVSYLHQALHLPEYGDVKIQLTVREDGTVVKMTVLKAESKKNREYLEQNLSVLHLPPWFSKKKEETFVLTFCNEL